MRIADACERWFPDAFVFALAAIVLVFGGGLAIGVAPSKLAYEFGSGFWSFRTARPATARILGSRFMPGQGLFCRSLCFYLHIKLYH